MMDFTREIRIAAAPDRVWAVLDDVPTWPDWTPTIRSVRPLDGSALTPSARFALRQPLQREAVWTVTALDPGTSFEWRSARFTAVHSVEPCVGGTICLAVLRPAHGDGGLAWRLLTPFLSAALAAEARGLRRACLDPHVA